MFFLVDATISYAKKDDLVKQKDNTSIKAIYISYLEYLNHFQGGTKSINIVKIEKMIDKILENGINNILLHVSPFSDSIYESKLFPYSYTLTGEEGKNPGFDYLDYFIKVAHSKNIKVHAWINPYRISFDSNINTLSDSNPAKKLVNTSSIMIDKNGIYYNPASEIVKDLIVRQIKEIINQYNVDGIHLDDYFYIQENIDSLEYTNYQNNGGNKTLGEFRLDNTNDLIKRIYKVIKEKNQNIIFSIAPDGNINNNYLYHYADVKTWLSSSEYLDVIMPQLYYGFNNEYLSFTKALYDWISIHKNKNVKIIPVLASYKVNQEDKEAGLGKLEWIEDQEVINKQISFLKENSINDYALFRYDFAVK